MINSFHIGNMSGELMWLTWGRGSSYDCVHRWVLSMHFSILEQRMNVKLCRVCAITQMSLRCSTAGAEVSMPWQFCMYCQAGARANNNHHINLLHWTQHLLKYRTERRAVSVLIPDSEKLETGRREKLRLKEGKNIKIKSSRNSRYSRVPGSSSLWVGWDGSDCSGELHQPGFLDREASASARAVSIIRVDGVLPPSQNHSLPVQPRTPV